MSMPSNPLVKENPLEQAVQIEASRYGHEWIGVISILVGI